MCMVCEQIESRKPAAPAIPPRPVAVPVNADAIPGELKARRQWVLWRYTWKTKEQKWDKPPLQISGRLARTNEPRTWTTFAAAICQYRTGKYDGIGYVPTEVDGFVFLDLDSVVRPDGTLGNWSPELRSHFVGDVPEPADVIAHLGTYAEVSPSGKGLRMICRGKLPEGRRKIGGKANTCPDGLEMYSAAHYLTITGRKLPECPDTLADATEALAALHLAAFGRPEPKPAAAPGPLPVSLLDDLAVIEKASRSKGGERFLKLWNGDASDYASRSEADFALAGTLAFYCGPNPAQVERLLRQSGLVRPKWDKRSYLAKTVTNCLKGRTEYYRGDYHQGPARVRHGCDLHDLRVPLESTVRANSGNLTHAGGVPEACRSQLGKSEWALSRRIRDKYDSNPWECSKAFGAAGRADGSPVLIAATCRKRSCPVCAQYWRLKTYDRFGFHLHNHDGEIYADTIPDFYWRATLDDMRRRAKKLGVPLRFASFRDECENLTVFASVPIRGDVAKPVALPEALEALEEAIDEVDMDGRRPVNACRAWGKLPDRREVQRVPGGCSPTSFRATLLAWKAETIGSDRFITCERPGLFLDSEGQLDEQMQCDFWREAETRDYAGDKAADEIRETLARARERRKAGSVPKIDPADCFHDFQERPDVDRPGWLVTDCPHCGKFFGRRPAEVAS